MKNGRSAAGVLIVMLLAYGASASAQSKQQSETQSKAPAQTADRSAEEMKREMQNARPGPEHKRLAKLAGEYTTATKFFAAPGAAPMESSGDAKLSLTLDGRFLVEEDTGTFAGQPSKAFKMLGYNNASKRYEGIWTYTMSTAIMTLNGTSSDGGKTATFSASWDDEGGARRNLQVVMRSIDDDHFVVELIDKSSAKAGPTLATTYARKK